MEKDQFNFSESEKLIKSKSSTSQPVNITQVSSSIDSNLGLNNMLNIILISIPVSLLTVAVVYTHALMDFDFDKKSGKFTFSLPIYKFRCIIDITWTCNSNLYQTKNKKRSTKTSSGGLVVVRFNKRCSIGI